MRSPAVALRFPRSTANPLAGSAPATPLVARVRAGDASALEALFHAHYDGLYGCAYRMVRSRAVAEEIIQEVFLQVWARRAQWTIDEGAERSYLYAAVRNGACRSLRRDRLADRTHALTDAAAVPIGMSEYAGGADARRDRDELVDVIRAAIATLPTRAQLAIRLRVERQLTNIEIAEVMGISIKAVEFNIGRAVRALRRSVRIG